MLNLQLKNGGRWVDDGLRKKEKGTDMENCRFDLTIESYSSDGNFSAG